MNNVYTRHDINKPAKSIEVMSFHVHHSVNIGGQINNYLASLSDSDILLSIDYRVTDNGTGLVAITTVLKGDSHEAV